MHKTSEVEHSLKYAPMLEGLDPQEAVKRASLGLLLKLADLSPKPDAGKALKWRLIFSANLSTRLLLREYDSNIRAIVGPLNYISANMDQFAVDSKISSLLTAGRIDPRAVFVCVDAAGWSATQHQEASMIIHRLLAKRVGLMEDIWPWGAWSRKGGTLLCRT